MPLYNTPLVLGHAALSWVERGSGPECSGGSLEDGFGDVMAVAAIVHQHMEIAHGIAGKGVPKILYQLAIKFANLWRSHRRVEDHVIASAQIDCERDQRFFHGQDDMTVTHDATLVTQRIAKAWPRQIPISSVV